MPHGKRSPISSHQIFGTREMITAALSPTVLRHRKFRASRSVAQVTADIRQFNKR
jgi:hypothetical protein